MSKSTKVLWDCDSCGKVVAEMPLERAENVVVDNIFRHPERGYDADLCRDCMVKALRDWADQLEKRP